MTADFYIQVLIFVCVIIAGGLAMWVCRILRMEHHYSLKELRVFLGFTLTYLLLSAGSLVYFTFKA